MAVFKYTGKFELPIGISFYTFQSMSYTIDVYRGTAKAEKNPINFGAYISLFPQLVAGPIVRFADVAAQLRERRVQLSRIRYGVVRFTCGLGKKVLLANQAGEIFQTITGYGTREMTTMAAWFGILAFMFQIYFDFSGYSDMAVGCAKCLGYDLDKNFDLPYISANVTEFWKRWHISLSSWLQQYLYISLGGNRRGVVRTYINLMVTMLLGGLWHGAGMNFILWGGLHGAALCLHKWWLKRKNYKPAQGFGRVISTLGTFVFVCLCWVFFRAPDMSTALQVLKKLLFWSGGVNHMYTWAIAAPILLMIATVWCVGHGRDEKGAVHGLLPIFTPGTFWGTLGFVLLVGFTVLTMYTGDSPFIYFQF